MRFLAGADIHGSHAVYDWLVQRANERGVDALVLAGDLLGCPDGYESIESAQRQGASAIVSVLQNARAPIEHGRMSTSGLVCLGVLLALAVGPTSACRADPWLTQTGCDTLGLDPMQVGIEFQIAPAGSYVQYFQVIPLPVGAPGGCAVEECTAPAGWVAVLHPGYSGAEFDYPQDYLPSGSTGRPFRIVIGAIPCSYLVRYFISGLPEWVLEETVTFTPLDEVAALPRSWGDVKARYR